MFSRHRYIYSVAANANGGDSIWVCPSASVIGVCLANMPTIIVKSEKKTYKYFIHMLRYSTMSIPAPRCLVGFGRRCRRPSDRARARHLNAQSYCAYKSFIANLQFNRCRHPHLRFQS